MPPLDKCGRRGRREGGRGRGQAGTEVGQTEDWVSAATEDVFIHSSPFGSRLKLFLSTFSPLLTTFEFYLKIHNISLQRPTLAKSHGQ